MLKIVINNTQEKVTFKQFGTADEILKNMIEKVKRCIKRKKKKGKTKLKDLVRCGISK